MGYHDPPYYFSAYGLAVSRGFKGTVDQWLESLKGDRAEFRYHDGKLQWRLRDTAGTSVSQWETLMDAGQLRFAVNDRSLEQVLAAVDGLMAPKAVAYEVGGLDPMTGETVEDGTSIRSEVIRLDGQPLAVTFPEGIVCLPVGYNEDGAVLAGATEKDASFTVSRFTYSVRLVFRFADGRHITDVAELAQLVTVYFPELHDLRYGVDGSGYRSAGEAVRRQFARMGDRVGAVEEQADTVCGALELEAALLRSGAYEVGLGPVVTHKSLNTSTGEVVNTPDNGTQGISEKFIPIRSGVTYEVDGGGNWFNVFHYVGDKEFFVAQANFTKGPVSFNYESADGHYVRISAMASSGEMTQEVFDKIRLRAVSDVALEPMANKVAALEKGSGAGQAGGYYVPSVAQKAEGTMEVAFTASREGMPEVAAQTVVLPVGPKGEQGIQGEQGPQGEKGEAGAPGYSPVRGVDYWKEEDRNAIVKEFATLTNVLDPDTVTSADGSELTDDSAKIQRCFDLLAENGGVITVTRTYTLTADIVINHNSTSHNNLITVAGTGQTPRIDFGAYRIKGGPRTDDGSRVAYGGVIFKDLRLTGDNIGFDCSNLIRLTFSNCMIRGFKYFVFAPDVVDDVQDDSANVYMQSMYIMGCYIRSSVDTAIKSMGGVYDTKIIGCVCEQGARLFSAASTIDSLSITDSCIEGFSEIPIVLAENNRAVNISNNYFETNGSGSNIDASAATGSATINISNNLFCEFKAENEYAGVVKLPTHFDNGCMTIVGNHCNYSYTVLLLIPDGATDLSKVYAFGNHGTSNILTDSEGDPIDVGLRLIDPAQIHKAINGLEKGVDYWTAEEKAEMVDDVLAAMSGEVWTFEMSDGSVIERTVATAHLTEFSSEAWAFTMEDGSVINKEVSVV